MTKNLDPSLVAVLVNREHSRLSSQVKSLGKLRQEPYADKKHQRLLTQAAKWRELLAFDDGAQKLAEALENFAAAYQQHSSEQESLHCEGEHYAFLTIRLVEDLKLRKVSILGHNCYILDPVRHAEQH